MRMAIAGVMLLLASGGALADAAPEPEEIDARLAANLRAAGQACPQPWRFERLSPEDRAAAADRHAEAQRILCGDGRRFLVSYRLRRARAGSPVPKHFVMPLR